MNRTHLSINLSIHTSSIIYLIYSSHLFIHLSSIHYSALTWSSETPGLCQLVVVGDLSPQVTGHLGRGNPRGVAGEVLNEVRESLPRNEEDDHCYYNSDDDDDGDDDDDSGDDDDSDVEGNG